MSTQQNTYVFFHYQILPKTKSVEN